MNKKLTNVLWGLCLVALGVIMIGNYMGIFNIDIFFDGWWTLFIIVPSVIGVFSKGDRTLSLIFLVIGVLMLLNQQHIITIEMVWKLLFPAVVIIVGLSLIISSLRKAKDNTMPVNCKVSKNQSYTAIFSGSERKYFNEEFNGASLTAVFGGVDLDLRDAIISKDVAINAIAIFGGCTILAPKNVNVKTTGTNIFGGTDNKIGGSTYPYTIYVNTTSIFGGVEIK